MPDWLHEIREKIRRAGITEICRIGSATQYVCIGRFVRSG